MCGSPGWSASSRRPCCSCSLVVVVVAVPRQRRWLVRALRAARVRRRWRRAWMDCGLLRVRAGRVRTIPAGELVRVRAARGTSLDALAGRAEELAVCLGLRELRVAPRSRQRRHRHGHARATRPVRHARDSAPWPHVDARGAVAVGADPGRRRRARPDRQRSGCPSATSCSAASPARASRAALSLLVATAALDPCCRLWLLDGKLVELSAWAPCAQRLAGPDVGEAIELLRELRGEMEERYRELLAARPAQGQAATTGCRCTWSRATSSPSTSRAEDRKQRAAFAELLRDLVARGRAAGVIVCAATQKPASDVGAVGVAGPVRVPAGAALQHAAGLGHDPRPGLGDARPQRGDDRARRSAASGCCSPRTARRSGCAASTCPTTSSWRSPSARARCAPTRGWPRRATRWRRRREPRQDAIAAVRARLRPGAAAARQRHVDHGDRAADRRRAHDRRRLAARPRRVLGDPRVPTVRRAVHPEQRRAALLHARARRQALPRVRRATPARRAAPARRGDRDRADATARTNRRARGGGERARTRTGARAGRGAAGAGRRGPGDRAAARRCRRAASSRSCVSSGSAAASSAASASPRTAATSGSARSRISAPRAASARRRAAAGSAARCSSRPAAAGSATAHPSIASRRAPTGSPPTGSANGASASSASRPSSSACTRRSHEQKAA